MIDRDNYDRKRAEGIAHTRAAVRVAKGLIMGAGGTLEIFDFHLHPELKEEVKKAFAENMPRIQAEELAKLGYT